MTKHQNLDAILKYMSENKGEIPLRPETIVSNANLGFEKSDSYMMLRMLLNDGYVYDFKEQTRYGILYKGIIFLDNGGYTLEHKINKRKMSAEKVSDYVNFIVKPLGIITTIIGVLWASIKILEFFGVVKHHIY